MTNFFTPTTRTLSFVDLLSFYGLTLQADNSEVPTGGYVFIKNNSNKLMRKLGFNEVLHRSSNYAGIEAFAKDYVASHCKEAKEIKRGIYTLTY